MKRFVSALAMIVILACVAGSTAFSADENIAKGCPVTSTMPFRGGNGPDVLSRITDGIYVQSYGYSHPELLYCETKDPVSITVDLGRVQPISGASFGTACGNDDWSQWPGAIMVFTSDDNKSWHFVCDLTTAQENYGKPSMDGPATYMFSAHGLKARGRYVRYTVFPHMECFFCYEAEVYKGGDELLTIPVSDNGVSDTLSAAKSIYFDSRVTYRLNSDAESVRDAVNDSNVSQEIKNQLNGQLDAIKKRIPAAKPENTPDFRAILPINDVDADIFAVYGSLLKARGLSGLYAWKENRYGLVSPTSVSSTKTKPSISISMMKNEYRADSLLLTNASDKPMEVKIAVKALPGGRRPKWLSIYALPWTDTDMGKPVLAAMLPAQYVNGAFVARIPAGLTSRIWLSVNSSVLDSGNYAGRIEATGSSNAVSVPFDLRVSDVKMARPRMSFCEWDYTVHPGIYAITPKNIDKAVAIMKDHFMDTPWARPSDFPLPGKDSFDAEGNLIKPLSLEAFDGWIRRWAGARHFMIYMDAPSNIAGFQMGTKEFDVRVGNWTKALAAHVRSLGVKPEEIGLMVRDEPGPDELQTIVSWAKAIKAANTGIKIFQDCNSNASNPVEIEAQHLTDISCPELSPFCSGGEKTQSFFAKLLSENHTLWIYQCCGPAHLLDPYQYNRLQAWRCFKYGASGLGLWAFADTGVFKNSWNEYTVSGPSYSQVFFFGDEIVGGIHYEAVREGIEDYEYLSMLRDAAKSTASVTLKAKAESLLKESLGSVLTGEYVPSTRKWTGKSDPTTADEYRLKILAMLEELQVSSK